jgi:hypothetical protein
MTPATRVATRFKLSMSKARSANQEDVLPILNSFRRVVEVMEKKLGELEAAPSDSLTPFRAAVYMPGVFEVLQKAGVARLFWGVLQQYKIQSSKDRKLIEQASKEFAKGRIQKAKREVAMAVLKKKIDDYKSYLDAAERIINKGEHHLDEASGTTEAAGCFTLINAGGFSPQQMADVVKVVELASSMIKSKGFGKLCYGTVQVTNTVGRSAQVLAFYVLQTDEMYVRGNLKGKQGPAVSTVIHELGHRLHHKFLHSKDAEIQSLYKSLLKGDEAALADALADKSNWPKPGELHEEGGKVYEVERVGLNRSLDYTVEVHLKQDPKVKASIALRSWLNVKGLKKETFVSPYARTSYGENFAEMFAHYVQGTLPDGQTQMLEAIIK